MYLPFIFGLGGPIGTGKQWMPWIHIDDVIGLIDWVINKKDVPSGPLNATAPNPVTCKEFTATLGRTLHRPAFIPMPAFYVKMIFGERSVLLLEGQRVIPQKALEFGYKFKFSNIDEALKSVYN